MTILQKPRQNGDRHAGNGWHRFGHGDQAVHHTEAWEPNQTLSSPGQRNLVTTVLAEFIIAIRRNTRMTDAYRSMSRSDSAPRDGGGLVGSNHDGPLRVA
jgi:hypothetical protein